MEALGYRIFEGDWNLNIVGLRNVSARFNRFDCLLVVFWKDSGNRWHYHRWPITTYPGRYYMISRLLNPRGAAILKPGQYRSAYAIRKHNGRYDALCQTHGSVTVYRDGDRDSEFDQHPEMTQTGAFGINIHSPVRYWSGMSDYMASYVERASAGCQVFASTHDFAAFMELVYLSRDIYGNRFTYTLLEI